MLEVVASQAAVATENARLLEQIVQSEQLSVIGRMAASIIHDLKQPMGVIRGFAELFGKPEVDTEKRLTFSNLILEDVDRFLEMPQELLGYSRGTMSLQPKEVKLGDWLGGLAQSLRENLVGSVVEVVTSLDFVEPVWIYEARMWRALIDVAGNAFDAMPDGGTFTIATRRNDADWELELRDTAKGIPPDLRPRIFEPFVTSGKEHGTGLGLAIAREVVEGQGGKIQFHSRIAGEEAGQSPGSVFTITLPAGMPTNDNPRG